ncbi:protein lin-28 homolog A-like [Styela clava]
MATGGGETGDSSSSETDKKTTEPDLDVEGMTKIFGTCKWFNDAKGFGFVSVDDSSTLSGDEEGEEGKPRPDIFVYQDVIKMPGFRSLRKDEKVEVWYKKSSKGLEAVKVAGPGGADCLGMERRPKRRKKADKCYNCDMIGHHVKECTKPPMAKRCHHCKSYLHLVAKCPIKHPHLVATGSTSNQGYGTEQQQQQQLPHSNGQSTSNQSSTSSSGQYQEPRYG